MEHQANSFCTTNVAMQSEPKSRILGAYIDTSVSQMSPLTTDLMMPLSTTLNNSTSGMASLAGSKRNSDGVLMPNMSPDVDFFIPDAMVGFHVIHPLQKPTLTLLLVSLCLAICHFAHGVSV